MSGGAIIAIAAFGAVVLSGLGVLAWVVGAAIEHTIYEAFGDVPSIHPEMRGVKPAGGNRTAGEAKSGRRASVTNGTQFKQTQTTSTSNQPAKSAGQGVK